MPTTPSSAAKPQSAQLLIPLALILHFLSPILYFSSTIPDSTRRAQKFFHLTTHRARRQTADTYLAAATFLDLLQIWSPHPPADVAQKAKYAKYHALRIAKALKAGEDPNLSNPARQDAAAQVPSATSPDAVVPLDPRDPEVQDIMGTLRPPSVRELGDEAPKAMRKPGGDSETQGYRPPTVAGEEGDAMEVDGDDDAGLTLLPSAAAGSPLARQPVSPPSIDGDDDDARRRASLGGGYFPSAPPQSQPHLPLGAAATSPSQPSSPPPPHLFPAPSTSDPHPHPQDQPASASASAPAPSSAPPTTAAPSQPSPSPPSAAQQQRRQEHYLDDDAAVAAAQKHARWAISALNFEDAPTAVRELRAALRALGVAGP